jgi:hypothetical protein
LGNSNLIEKGDDFASAVFWAFAGDENLNKEPCFGPNKKGPNPQTILWVSVRPTSQIVLGGSFNIMILGVDCTIIRLFTVRTVQTPSLVQLLKQWK